MDPGNRGRVSTRTITRAPAIRHNGFPTAPDREKGAAIVMALLVVVLILLLGAVLVSETLASGHNAALTSKSVQVVSAARAGTSAGIASLETALGADNTGVSTDLTCQSITSTSNYNGNVGAANGAGNAASAGWYTLYWGLATGSGGQTQALTDAESAADTGASLPWQSGADLSYGKCGTSSTSQIMDASTLRTLASTDTTIWVAFEAVGQTASPVFQNSAGNFQGADTSVTTVKLTDIPVCAICLLGGGTSNMLLSEGGANLNVKGGVIYDSSSGTPAASTSGGGTVSASGIDVVGTTQGTGFTPTPTTGISPWGDAGLAVPDPPPTSPITGSNVTCSSSCTRQLSPGNYGNVKANGTVTIGSSSCTSANYDTSSCITYMGSLDVGSQANVTLDPGIYVFEGAGPSATPYTGGFTVEGGGTLIAKGVMLYFTCSTGSCTSPGSLGGYASFAGGSNVTLTSQCSTCGTYPYPYGGIVIYQDPNDASPMKLAGNSTTVLKGTIYAPGAAVDLVGTSQTKLSGVQNIQLDVASVSTSGTGYFNMQADTNYNHTNWHALVQTIN